MDMKHIRLEQISSRSWEHPADRLALVSLRKIGGLDEVIRKVIGATTEKSLRLMHLASAVKVGDQQFHRIYNSIQTACDILDAPFQPDVFITQSPFFNSSVMGADRPFIVIQSAILANLSDEELLCVIGHELGHIMSGHAMYKTLLWLLLNISFKLVQIPFSNLILIPIVLALKEWDRKSELSADRASLLVSQSDFANYEMFMKMSGGNFVSEMNVNDFFMQASEYENDVGALDSLYKLLNMLNATHPFSVIRLKELKSWAVSGEYDRILKGEYVRRGAEKESVRETLKEAQSSYSESFQKGKAQVTDTMEALRSGADKIADGLGKVFNDIFKSK